MHFQRLLFENTWNKTKVIETAHQMQLYANTEFQFCKYDVAAAVVEV